MVVFELIEQLGDIVAREFGERAVLPTRVDVFLETALDLGLRTKPVGRDVPFDEVLGHLLE
jgi:hypothetical protein